MRNNQMSTTRQREGPAGPLAASADAVPPLPRRRRAWVYFLAVAAGLAVLSVFVSPGQAQWLATFAGSLSLAALLEAVTAERATVPLRSQPWVLIGLGVALMVSCELFHALGAGTPSYADALGLASYPLLIAGLVRLTRARFRESALDTLLIAAIFPASLGVFAWLPLVEAIQRWVPGADQQAWSATVFLAVDALAVAIIARLTVFFRGKPASYQLLLGAFACSLGAHVSRTVSSVTRLVPAPFGSQTLMVLCFGLVAAAALHPSMRWAARAGRARSVTIGTGHVGLLIVAILFGPAIVIWRFSDRGSWVVLAAAGPATVSLLVVAHLSRMISERQRLEFASNHDALTGLVNRSCFQDRVGAALQDASLAGESLAVMFLDLDRFKTVNDSLGHDAGDEMLKQVAVRLTDCARDSDTVARISGDEFAVLLPAVTTAEQAAEIATRMLAHFEGLFEVAGHDLVMSPSIGVAMAPAHGDDVETLLRHADAAMYQAKAGGRNTMRMYDGSMGAQAQRQLSLESRIRDAIEREELVLHYQPMLDARSGSVVGVEALVRWAHPDMGLIPPAAFMRVVEDSGLVAPLGEWVLRNACAQAARWRAEGYSDLPVSVNVSARQFQLQDLPTVVRDALAAASLPAAALELELTESVGLDPSGSALRALQEVQRLGVRCSIDDFGTGYSSIGYLKDYPVNAIKLDRSFLEDVQTGEDAPIVRAVIAMAHHLGLRVVAEGVETTAQLEFLRRNGCDELQGFLFSRPLPEDELMAYLADRPETLDVPPLRVVPDSQPGATWDEERLGRVVWEQSRARSGQLRDAAGLLGAEETGRDHLRRTLVITTASAAVALPLFLGLGAGGGLPPDLQSQVDGAVRAMGGSTPRPPAVTPPDGAITAQGGPTANQRSGHGQRTPSAQPLPSPAWSQATALPSASPSTSPAGPSSSPAASATSPAPAPTTTASTASTATTTATPTAPAVATKGRPTAPPAKGSTATPTPGSPGAKPTPSSRASAPASGGKPTANGATAHGAASRPAP